MGIGWLYRLVARLLNRDQPVPLVVGLDAEDGTSLIKPYCPSNYFSMKEAVHAVVEIKWGHKAIFREGASESSWQDPSGISDPAPDVSEAPADATVAYCSYLP